VSLLTSVLSVLLLLGGMVFFFGGTLGLVRLPDLYTRAHAASKCESGGAGSILLALALHNGLDIGDAKLILLLALVLVSGPTSAHALARDAFRTGLVPWTAPERRER
jgi:multicomponent Na+:H+ antiporter subunit G